MAHDAVYHAGRSMKTSLCCQRYNDSTVDRDIELIASIPSVDRFGLHYYLPQSPIGPFVEPSRL